MAQVVNISEAVQAPALNEELMNRSAWELEILKGQKKDLEAQIAELENVIKNAMTENSLTEIVAGGFKITYKEYIQDRFDTTRFRKERPDDYKKFCKETKYMRFEMR